MQTTDVREAAQNAVDQSKSFLGKQLDDRSTQIGEHIGSVADDLRNVGDQLRQSGSIGPAAGYVEQGADAIDRFGAYLRDADSDRLIADLEGLARRQPWTVAAAALALGFAASRFLKTSSARRYRAGYDSPSAGSPAYGGSRYGETTYGSRTYGDRTYVDRAYGVAATGSGDARYAT